MLLMLSICVSAHDFEENGIYYKITSSTEHTVAVTYQGETFSDYPNRYMGVVTIPNSVTHDDISYSVTTIGDNSFNGCINLTEINMPTSILKIGSSAFSECEGLSSISIPTSVTSISSLAFHNCAGLTSLVIPDNVTSLGSSAFYGCNLKSVVIGNGIPTIYDYTFSRNTIKSLIVGKSVKEIKRNAFSTKPKKTSWLSYTLPTGYEYAEGSFRNYTRFNSYYRNITLKNKKMYTNILDMFEKDGVIYIPSSDYSSCDVIDCSYDASKKEIFINKTVVNNDKEMTINKIEGYAFFENTVMESVSIMHNGIIGEYAFSGCSNLQKVVLGESVTKLAEYSFNFCNSLRRIICEANTPPQCLTNALEDIDKSTCSLQVPAGAISAYQNTAPWKEFSIIEETTGIDTINNDEWSISGYNDTIYTLDGIKVNSLKKGLNIIKTKDGSVKKIWMK